MAENSALEVLPDSFGSVLIEFLMVPILYGVTIVQTYIYIYKGKHDHIWMKSMVGAIWVIETVHTAAVCRLIYLFTISAVTDPTIFFFIDWSAAMVMFAELLITVAVQGFYIWRIWILSNHKKILVSIVALAFFIRIVFVMSTTVYLIICPTWTDYILENRVSILVIKAAIYSSVVDNFAIAGTTIYYLYHRKTRFPSQSVIRWLMAYSIHSGAIMIVLAIATLITLACLNGSLVYAGLIAIDAKLLANSLLGSLNARATLRSKMVNGAVNADSTNFELFSVSSSSRGRVLEVQGDTLPATVMDIRHKNDGENDWSVDSEIHERSAPRDI
ncbi:unnamed protein product [Somion occarium]|uniref:DUF6534 domain-containing protein n=1 Tax=Somion occarium TaxID=3059160 RepID=A0ABP1D6S3_9APHY